MSPSLPPAPLGETRSHDVHVTARRVRAREVGQHVERRIERRAHGVPRALVHLWHGVEGVRARELRAILLEAALAQAQRGEKERDVVADALLGRVPTLAGLPGTQKMVRDEDTRVVEGHAVLSGGVNAERNLRHHPDVPGVTLLAPRPRHPPPRLLEPRLHLGDVLGSPRARRPRREDILRRLRRLRMQPKLPDDDVGERPGPRPLERVPVCVVREDAVRRPRDVIANLSQRRVPRRAREHPVEHLPPADEVPAVRHLIRSELVLPAHNQGIRAPEV